jgi:hypothetical protein
MAKTMQEIDTADAVKVLGFQRIVANIADRQMVEKLVNGECVLGLGCLMISTDDYRRSRKPALVGGLIFEVGSF